MKTAVIAFFAFMLGLPAAVAVLTYVVPPVPVAAVGLAVCGQMAGVAIIDNNGAVTRLTPEAAAELLPVIKKLQPEKRVMLTWNGEQCNGRPRVY